MSLRVRLIGDHSAYHGGSWAVWQVLCDRMRALGHEIVPEGAAYDLMVCNGEGSMHHGRRPFRLKMEALRGALEAGRRAALVNTLWQDNPPDYDDVLRGLDLIVTREVRSRADLRDRHGIEARCAIDLSWFQPLPDAPPGPAVPVLATDFFSREFATFVRPTGGPLGTLPHLDMGATGWAETVRRMQGAALVVTGRHHGVYAACRAGVPFLALDGNSHKIAGLFEGSGQAIPLFDDPARLVRRMRRGDLPAARYEALFRWMDGHDLEAALPAGPLSAGGAGAGGVAPGSGHAIR